MMFYFTIMQELFMKKNQLLLRLKVLVVVLLQLPTARLRLSVDAHQRILNHTTPLPHSC